MTKYQRMTYEKRCLIGMCLKVNFSKSEIAKMLNVHKSTISRELQRNSRDGYYPSVAQETARKRFENCRRRLKLRDGLILEVAAKIKERWSPEQISGRFKLEKKKVSVSHETIYKFLRKDKKAQGEIWVHLRKAQVKRGRSRFSYKKHRPDWQKPIGSRLEVINKRKRFGDWERDLMVGRDRGAVLVCVERKSKYLKVGKVTTYKSVDTFKNTTDLLASTKTKVHSITNDNGTEFGDGYLFSIPVYYCDPRKPQQRGTVENTIGLLRQYYPKGTHLKEIDEAELKILENKMNLRPRKCLDYKTPYEVLYKTRVALVS